MQGKIQLIVGLGNPGAEYEETRHNAGAWLIERFIAQLGSPSLHSEKKFHGLYGKALIGVHDCHLLQPTTFMNHSGQAIQAITQFYKIDTQHVLVVHDDLDLPPGVARLKRDGGHGGHNGLRDAIHHLKNKNFLRLRIGIGHPGHRDHVTDYVLKRPSRMDYDKILQAIDRAIAVLPLIVAGEIEKATHQLHSQSDTLKE